MGSGPTTAEIANSTATENRATLRRAIPRLELLLKLALIDGRICICDECEGKGYPGKASLTNCKICAGSGYCLPEAIEGEG